MSSGRSCLAACVRTSASRARTASRLLERLAAGYRQSLQPGQRGKPVGQLSHVHQPTGIRFPGVPGGAAVAADGAALHPDPGPHARAERHDRVVRPVEHQLGRHFWPVRGAADGVAAVTAGAGRFRTTCTAREPGSVSDRTSMVMLLAARMALSFSWAAHHCDSRSVSTRAASQLPSSRSAPRRPAARLSPRPAPSGRRGRSTRSA